MSSWIGSVLSSSDVTVRCRPRGWIQITNMQIVERQLRTLRMWQTFIYHKAIALRWRNIQRHWSNSPLGHPDSTTTHPQLLLTPHIHARETRQPTKGDKSTCHGWLSKGPGGQYSSDSSPPPTHTRIPAAAEQDIYHHLAMNDVDNASKYSWVHSLPEPKQAKDHRLCPAKRTSDVLKSHKIFVGWQRLKKRQHGMGTDIQAQELVLNTISKSSSCPSHFFVHNYIFDPEGEL